MPTERPGVARDGVEPLEHVRDVVGRDARTVVGDDDRDAVRRRDARSTTSIVGGGVLQRVLHEVRDDLGRAVRDRARPASDAPGSTCELEAEVAGLRRERFGRVAHDLGQVARSRIQGELAAVEPRQVEEVAHEPFEAARFGADHRRGALARVGVGVVEGAVGERLRVAADRRERRAQVVRDREQERALAARATARAARPSR